MKCLKMIKNCLFFATLTASLSVLSMEYSPNQNSKIIVVASCSTSGGVTTCCGPDGCVITDVVLQ